MDKDQAAELRDKCREIRYLTMDAIGRLGVGHVGGSMSAVEALVVLYYRHLRIDPRNPKREGRDRFVLSKGHAGPALYSVLADKGYFSKELLATLNQPETSLPSHADMLRTPGIDMTAGSLGQGISCSVGIALGSRLRKDGARIYVLIGDGEAQEGQLWEAAMYAGHQRLDNLIVLCDYNNLQCDGEVTAINSLEPFADKWAAFGWHVIEVRDGHDAEKVDEAVVRAKTLTGKPTIIILHTVKGKGVNFAENNASCHNTPVSKEQWEATLVAFREPQNV